ncbi:bacillithiol biosynthesis deacetylase BshB1 [Desmospora profundinema]|uniref:Bacillithiol biosynthesis deacetylase BshB1 n=1 Tax=Desmospora profundinema TaxID=1571184 RepID=A0ABU1II70_9BACL|nr:bacillithiol biosynthesis deacetylase BshB1 [Desmospora profundinema]
MTSTVDLLAFGAHPDDVEIGTSGILWKHARQGFKTAICDLTDGELSSNGDVVRRRAEADRAGEILGLTRRLRLGLPDRGLTGTAEQLNAVVQVIRMLKPRVVLAPHWEDRHPDHTACARMVKEAVFDAAIRKRELDTGEAPHRVEQLFHYFINHTGKADVIVDVSEGYEQKEAAILAYESQFVPGPGRVETPLNRPTYLPMIRGRDQLWGHEIGVLYGEGLVSPRPIAMGTLIPERD